MSCQYKTDIVDVKPGRPTTNAVVHYSLRQGRDSAQFRCWWDQKKYVACQAAKLEAENGCVYYLVWPRSFDARIDLVWSVKNSTVNFTKIKGVKHLALFCNDKLTCLRHWTAGKMPNQQPALVSLVDTCPDGCEPGEPGPPNPPDPIDPIDPIDPDVKTCKPIQDLPRIDTGDPPAERSTLLFDICVDVNALPSL